MGALSQVEKRVPAPKLGEVVHYVVHADNEELGTTRGEEVAMLVTGVFHTEDKLVSRWEVEGTCFASSAFFRVRAVDDFEHELPGTWHRDRDCLEAMYYKATMPGLPESE